MDVCTTEIHSCILWASLLALRQDLKFTTVCQHSTSKIHLDSRDTRHIGVVRGLEIYEGPKISNYGLTFVTTRDVSQQKSSHLSVL